MQNSLKHSSATLITTVSTAALAAVFALATGCAVDANDGPEAATDDVPQTTSRLPPPTPPVCLAVPLPVLSRALAPYGSQGWHGTQGTASGYGTQCTADYVIETTNTLGAGDLELSASSPSDDAMNRSAIACGAASITVEAWGCTSIDAAGGCLHWSTFPPQTAAGQWNTGGLGPNCGLAVALPSTTAASPYFMLRLGAIATKQVLGSRGNPVTVLLPIDARIGYEEIN